MNIAGVLIHTHPRNSEQVRKNLLRMRGVEVHATTEDGRMVVTIDEDDYGTASDHLMNFHSISGVLSASLIYHHFEPDAGVVVPQEDLQ